MLTMLNVLDKNMEWDDLIQVLEENIPHHYPYLSDSFVQQYIMKWKNLTDSLRLHQVQGDIEMLYYYNSREHMMSAC